MACASPLPWYLLEEQLSQVSIAGRGPEKQSADELKGNVGTLTGPPFFDALEKALGKHNLAIQGVGKYLANVSPFLWRRGFAFADNSRFMDSLRAEAIGGLHIWLRYARRQSNSVPTPSLYSPDTGASPC
jgi:hypothetical protein